MNKILKKYNVIGDDFFYHHTLNEKNGNIYYHGPEVHRQYEVLYLIRGEISYIIEGETYNATPGDIIFISPNEIHTLKINGNLDYERAVVLFDMSIMDKLAVGFGPFTRDESRSLRMIKKDTIDRFGIKDILFSIIECNEDEPYKRMKIISKLIEFLICIDKIAKGITPSHALPSSIDSLIQKINLYIDEHLCEAITLDSMAKELFVSKSTLSHRFTTHMNMTLNRYIAIKKMHRANELMREGMSATQASREVGYDNYTSFYYNYKQILGISPGSKGK